MRTHARTSNRAPQKATALQAQRHLIENLYVEILARAQAIWSRSQALLSEHFISQAPVVLAETIGDVACYFGEAVKRIFGEVDWETPDTLPQDIRQLQLANQALLNLAAHLRYVDGARTEQLPWGSVPAFEKWADAVLPGVQLLIRPKWNYNYSVDSDLRDDYENALAGFHEDEDGSMPIGRVLSRMSRPFHVLAFPSLERENILLHCLLGHEIGHLLAEQFLTDERATRFAERVRARVEEETRREVASFKRRLKPLFLAEFNEQVLAENTSHVLTLWRRAMEELLSDCAGALLFGPAALYSSVDLAVSLGDMDAPPLPHLDYYPPWRLRLRHIHRLLGERGWLTIPPDFLAGDKRRLGVQSRLDLIADLVHNQDDAKVLGALPYVKIVYEQIETDIQDGVRFLIQKHALDRHLPAPADFYARLPALIARLDVDLPPNAFEQSFVASEPAPLALIINTAWFHKILTDAASSDNAGVLDQRDRRNRLTLKAIELSDLAAEHAQRFGPSVADVAGHAVAATAGKVLGADQIRAWMQRPKLADRLVVTPLLQPTDQIGASSVDVRLGNQFIVMQRQAFPSFDVGDPEAVLTWVRRTHKLTIWNYHEGFVLHPGQLVLGSTLEYVQVPMKLMAYVIGKSSWGRMGLVIATATKVDPGFKGCITLEIVNEGEIPLVLYPGLPIAQLVLHGTGDGSSYRGAYSCAVGPEFPKFHAADPSWRFWTEQRRTLPAARTPE